MSEAAVEFFAKKRKKKTFKFNANLIDVNSLAPATYTSDSAVVSVAESGAPNEAAMNGSSADNNGRSDAMYGNENNNSNFHNNNSSNVASYNSNAMSSSLAKNDDNEEQWDDEALAARLNRGAVVGMAGTGAGSGVGAEILDMKTFDSKRNNTGNIAEKLRVEETKAKLAAAREGMEREGAKLKEEREKKEQEKLQKQQQQEATRGNIWVPPHLRGVPGTGINRGRLGGGTSQSLDVQDEELFPDLAAADKILEKKEKEQQPSFKVNKKTPVGGGASWASKLSNKKSMPPLKKEVAPPQVEPSKPKEVPARETEPSNPPIKKEVVPAPEPVKQMEVQSAAPTPEEAKKEETPPPAKKEEPAVPQPTAASADAGTKKKKKKRDVSTFKPTT